MQTLIAVWEHLRTRGTRMEKPCTARGSETCWIFQNLSPWNEILHFVDLELKEDVPGKLVLQSLDVEIILNFSRVRVLEAAILLYWLLGRHRCVDRIDMFNDAVTTEYPSLLSHALSLNKGLRHLKLSSLHASEEFGDSFSVAIRNMQTLRTLDIAKIKLGRNAVGRIGDMLRESESMERVKFMENGMDPYASLTFVRNLSSSTALRTLCIDDCQLEVRGAETLGRLLASNETIAELSVKFISNLDDEQFMSIVRPLKTNKMLQKIEFCGGVLTTKGLSFLENVLKENKSLKYLYLMDCNIKRCEAEVVSNIMQSSTTLLELHLQANKMRNAGAKALVRGIENNETLRELGLEDNVLSYIGVAVIATALRRNRTLERVTLGHVETNRKQQSIDLSRTLRQTGVCERLRLSYDIFGFLETMHMLKTTSSPVSEVNVDGHVELGGKQLANLCAVLRPMGTLRKLRIEATAEIDETVALKVAKFLASSVTLKHFHLNTANADEAALSVLIKGLKKNSSIECVEMEYSAYDIHVVHAFLDFVKENRRVSSFRYYRTTREYLKLLSRELANNYTLTTFKVWEESGFKCTMLTVNEILRRNELLVNRAVQFTTHHRVDPDMAKAFERFRDLGLLEEHLTRSVEMSEEDARAAIKSAEKFVTENYFRLTRVTRRGLVCHGAPGGETQIDRLNYECWLEIFSYLKVSDVVDA